MFESRISAGAKEKYLGGKNSTQKLWRGPLTWKDMLKNALKSVANWRTKKGATQESFESLLGWSSTSRRKSLNQLESYHMRTHKMS